MPIINLSRFFSYCRDALSGLGILYVCHLTGIADLTVTSMHIDAAQAEAVAEQVFNGEHVISKKKGAK
jgi:hypothetical protein